MSSENENEDEADKFVTLLLEHNLDFDTPYRREMDEYMKTAKFRCFFWTKHYHIRIEIRLYFTACRNKRHHCFL